MVNFLTNSSENPNCLFFVVVVVFFFVVVVRENLEHWTKYAVLVKIVQEIKIKHSLKHPASA